ncbi:MAG: hypothetical protein WC763_06890 [Candidatus Paceibacterota bacterium]|jgi:hypothetical protein
MSDLHEKNKCYQLLSSLLTLARDPPKASVFVRELEQTAWCDSVLDTEELALVRERYAQHIGPEAHARVLNYQRQQQTETDEERCTQALTHYKVWTTTQLRHELPYWQQATRFFQVKVNAESTFAVVGLVTTGLVAVKGASAMIRHSNEWLKAIRTAKSGKSI